MSVETWRVIPEFPDYQISDFGRVYNSLTGHYLAVSPTNFGHVRISLVSNVTGHRRTRSVAQLVAESFVKAPHPLCNRVLILDGNLRNLKYTNLVWRPGWFQWKYVRQFKTPQPRYMFNLPVRNVNTGIEYESICEAAMYEGLLFEDIWISTYTGKELYPTKFAFEIVKCV